MTALQWVIDKFIEVSDLFFSIYSEVTGWIAPFNYIDMFFYDLGLAFWWAAFRLWDFKDWLEALELERIHAWFTDWWGKILTQLDVWWSATSVTVQTWIDIATEGLAELKIAWSDFWNVTFPQWTSKLDALKVEWDDFWNITFPSWTSVLNTVKAQWDNFNTLIAPYVLTTAWATIWWNDRLIEINNLIDSALKIAFPFYDDLVALWSSIASFFTDPLGWLEARFIDWFLGGE